MQVPSEDDVDATNPRNVDGDLAITLIFLFLLLCFVPSTLD